VSPTALTLPVVPPLAGTTGCLHLPAPTPLFCSTRKPLTELRTRLLTELKLPAGDRCH